MEGKGRKQCWAGVRAGTVGAGGRRRGACWAVGCGEGHRQWMGRPMTSLGSQLYRVAFLAAVLLLLWAKGVKPQKGGPGPDERSWKVETLSTGRSGRDGVWRPEPRSVWSQSQVTDRARAKSEIGSGYERMPVPVMWGCHGKASCVGLFRGIPRASGNGTCARV